MKYILDLVLNYIVTYKMSEKFTKSGHWSSVLSLVKSQKYWVFVGVGAE